MVRLLTSAATNRCKRPPALGAALGGREEEELVLQVLRRKDLFRYYGRDGQNPPAMGRTLEKEFGEMLGFRFPWL